MRGLVLIALLGFALAACPAPTGGGDGAAADGTSSEASAPDAQGDGGAFACPFPLPVSGTACSADPSVACVYGATGCGATYSYRRCACVDAGWRCPCLSQ